MCTFVACLPYTACLNQHAALKEKVKRLQGATENAVGEALSKQLRALQATIDRVKLDTEQHNKEARKALLTNVRGGFKPLMKMAGSQQRTAAHAQHCTDCSLD